MLRAVLLTSVRTGSGVCTARAAPCLSQVCKLAAVSKCSHVPNPSGEGEGGDQDRFGDCSRTFSSRMSFQKASAELQDARHAKAEVELDEPDIRCRSERRSRNTPYWYLLQCKKLLKQEKVRENTIITS